MLSRHRKTPADPVQTSLGAGRRTLILLALVAVAGFPAAALRAFCAGHSCDEPADASSEVPFCSLPEDVRGLVAAGFREGRSPDVLAIARDTGLTAHDVPWPSTRPDTRVPIAFWGRNVDPFAVVPEGTGLDDVAPTIESILGFERPHPDVRSGEAVEGVTLGFPAKLVVEIVWIGRGSGDFRGPLLEPFEEGPATMDGDTTSVPVDPVAALTTIGTGGRPAQHGITGENVRDDAGALRQAWSPRSPVSVIATLGDDLDEELDQKPLVGMVAARRAYLGAIGGNWYVDVDRDEFVRAERGDEPRAVRELLGGPYGEDDTPDLVVVAVEGGPRAVVGVLRQARRHAGDEAAFVLTATGDLGRGDAFDPEGMPGDDTAGLVEAVAPGGLFLDQAELARRKVGEEVVSSALTQMKDASGDPLFADVFPAIAVAFGRYC